ncbi:MAG TPA: sialidase family protein [Opitutaceae bacterium]|nr:sialidase family protein [Opitutaceae bacterium]
MTFRSSVFISILTLTFSLAMTGMLEAAAPNPAILRSEFIYDIGSYPSVHASTIVESSRGELLASWFGGTNEKNPDVCIYVSRFENGKWLPADKVADGVQSAGQRYPTWNPVLFQPRDGPLMLFYKVGPSPQNWWGMLITSSDGGRTWSEPRRLPDGVLGPIKNKPIQLADGTILAPSSTEDKERGWRIHVETTRDLGNTWEIVGPLNTKHEFNAIQPTILTHRDGRLQMLSRTKEMVLVTNWSSDQGQTWTKLEPTGLFMPNSGCDAVTLKDGRQLLVYNWRDHPAPKEVTTHKDDENGPSPRGTRSDYGVRYPLNISLSEDGVNWKMVLTLEDEPRPHGYAYPAVIQSSDGLVHVTYTWNREKIKHVIIDPARLLR